MEERLRIAVRLVNVIDGTVDDRRGTIDMQASCTRYADALARRLLTLYPGADVQVSCGHRPNGAIQEDLDVAVPDALDGTANKARGFATLQEEIWHHITEIRSELRSRTDWVVYQ